MDKSVTTGRQCVHRKPDVVVRLQKGASHHHGGRMRVGSARVGQREGKESQVQGHKDVFTNVPELTELMSLYPLKCSSVLAAVRLTETSCRKLFQSIV